MAPIPSPSSGDTNPLTLKELAGLSGFEPRTIRHYIERGLLPGSHGRGRGAGYGAEHLDRLRFIGAVRSQAKLSLTDLADLLHGLPPEQIQRIGRGEEDVHAMRVGGAEDWDADEAMPSSMATPWFSPKHSRFEPDDAPKEAEREFSQTTWTTAEITDGLELRQRGHDPRNLKRMMSLAKRLRQWLEEERGVT
jgi:DNA-binding transcriptional MerR regulator